MPVGGPRGRHFVKCYVGITVYSTRNMHALGRPELECSLKIYVEIYEKPRVNGIISVFPSPVCNLTCSSLCISDCVG